MAQAGAGASVWLLLLLLLFPLATAAICPDACACFRDARLWLALPREDSLTARCARRGLTALPTGLDGDVRHLDVSGNWLVRLDAGAFVQLGLRRLLSLDASSNVLDDVRPGAFRGLTALRRVSLAYNRLQTLPADLFAEAPDLWSLSLAGNPLVVPHGTPVLSAPALRLLDVSDCKLRLFPDALLGADNALQELIAARNGFAEVRVSRLRHLRRLDVSDNHLRQVPSAALREAAQLRSLVLDGNALRLPNATSPLVSSPSLRALSAARCGLSALHGDVFNQVPSLEEVSLETNGLTALPRDAFSSLPALQRVNLRANRLEGLPKGVFAGNPALRALDLSHNHLDADLLLAAAQSSSEEENGPWLEVKSLRELSLSHCGLRSLPAALFLGVPSLRNLTASGNFLRTVDAQLLEPLPKLRALDLRENPLQCDAKLHGLWLAVQARHVRTVATCVEPPGDWEMLRFFGSSNAIERVTPESNQSFTDSTTSGEEGANVMKTAAISDALIENSVRWGPPIGVIVVAVVFVFAFRKWINRMNGKGDYDEDPYARDFAYESDEDETVNMTLTTDGGTPRVTPTVASSPRPSRGSLESRFAVSCVGDEAPLTDAFVDPSSPHRPPRLSVGR